MTKYWLRYFTGANQSWLNSSFMYTCECKYGEIIGFVPYKFLRFGLPTQSTKVSSSNKARIPADWILTCLNNKCKTVSLFIDHLQIRVWKAHFANNENNIHCRIINCRSSAAIVGKICIIPSIYWLIRSRRNYRLLFKILSSSDSISQNEIARNSCRWQQVW